MTPQGKWVNVSTIGARKLVFIATWCPTCKWWLKVWNDPEIQPYFKKNVAFVLDREWRDPDIAAHMRKGATFYDAQVVAKLPAPYYVAGSETRQDADVAFYPAGYSYSTGNFDQRVEVWMVRDVKIPQALLDRVASKYPSSSSH